MKLKNHSKIQYCIHGKRTGKQTSDSVSTEVFSHLNACHSAKEKKSNILLISFLSEQNHLNGSQLHFVIFTLLLYPFKMET